MKRKDLIEATFKRQSALGTLLEQMEVPEMRRATSVHSTVRWLQRNLAVQNK